MLSIFDKIPWTLFVVFLMIMTHVIGLNVSMSTVLGPIFFIMYALALILEFVKSGNTNENAFFIDLIFSVVSVITVTIFMSYLMFVEQGKTVTIVDAFGAFIIVVDAILSPRNSFKAALRDFGGGGHGGAY